jgi:hypothetical protein
MQCEPLFVLEGGICTRLNLFGEEGVRHGERMERGEPLKWCRGWNFDSLFWFQFVILSGTAGWAEGAMQGDSKSKIIGSPQQLR